MLGAATPRSSPFASRGVGAGPRSPAPLGLSPSGPFDSCNPGAVGWESDSRRQPAPVRCCHANPVAMAMGTQRATASQGRDARKTVMRCPPKITGLALGARGCCRFPVLPGEPDPSHPGARGGL